VIACRGLCSCGIQGKDAKSMDYHDALSFYRRFIGVLSALMKWRKVRPDLLIRATMSKNFCLVAKDQIAPVPILGV